MLLEHYKLALQPFGVTPDPSFLYLSPTHREAMASLLHGIRSQAGFTALIAAPGMGKTTLLFNLLHILKERNVQTGFLFQPLCRPDEFLNALLADLGIEDDGENLGRMHAKLNEYLLCESQRGRQVVLVIDEAQNLTEPILEAVRALSNFETSSKKLLHVILAGQPQLAARLCSDSLIQLRQRISIVARLAPLNVRETREYIEHRLSVAGHCSSTPLFNDKAYDMIAAYSQGIPRNINTLCFNALSLACALRRTTVDALMVQESIEDLDLRVLAAPVKQFARQSVPAPQFTVGGSDSANWRMPAVLLLAALVFSVALAPVARQTNDTVVKEKPLTSVAESSATVTSPGEPRTPAVLPGVRHFAIANRNHPIRGAGRAVKNDHHAATDILGLHPMLSDVEPQLETSSAKVPLTDRVEGTTPSAIEPAAIPFESTQQRGTP